MPSCNGTGSGFGVPTAAPPGSDPPQSPPPDPHTPPHAVDVRLHRCRHVEVDDGGHVLEVDAPRHAVLGVSAFTAGGNEMGGGWGGEGNPVSVGTRSPGRGTPPTAQTWGHTEHCDCTGGALRDRRRLCGSACGGASLWGHPWDPGGTHGTLVGDTHSPPVAPTAPQWHPGVLSAPHSSSVAPMGSQCHPQPLHGTHSPPVALIGPQCHPQPPTATQGSSVPPTAPQCHQWVLSAPHSPSAAPMGSQCHPQPLSATHSPPVPLMGPQCHPQPPR